MEPKDAKKDDRYCTGTHETGTVKVKLERDRRGFYVCPECHTSYGPGSEVRNDKLGYKIRVLESEMQEIRQEYLRASGWKELCDFPGAYWLWTRELPDSGVPKVDWFKGTIAVNEDMAVKLQQAIDNWFLEYEGE